MEDRLHIQARARPYATNLLTRREKTLQDIEDAKRRVDENEK